jgi:hypothetical protein
MKSGLYGEIDVTYTYGAILNIMSLIRIYHSKSIPSKTRQGGGAARSEPDWMASPNPEIGPEPIRGLTFSCFSRKKRILPFLLEHFAFSQRDYGN